jgi:hypothetical protein
MMIGYFTVNPDAGQGHIDWSWLEEAEEVERTDYVKHLRFDDPLVVMMNGHRHQGIIYKPGEVDDNGNGRGNSRKA